VVEAVQWKGKFTKKMVDFLGTPIPAKTALVSQEIKLIIPTLEGQMTADIGDWIIKGVNGEFYPCKPDIFKKTYEKVKD
jgi:hypothetical protein